MNSEKVYAFLIYLAITGMVVGMIVLGIKLASLNTEEEIPPTSTTTFEGNKEVTQFYYEGWVTVKVSDNSLEILLDENFEGKK